MNSALHRRAGARNETGRPGVRAYARPRWRRPDPHAQAPRRALVRRAGSTGTRTRSRDGAPAARGFAQLHGGVAWEAVHGRGAPEGRGHGDGEDPGATGLPEEAAGCALSLSDGGMIALYGGYRWWQADVARIVRVSRNFALNGLEKLGPFGTRDGIRRFRRRHGSTTADCPIPRGEPPSDPAAYPPVRRTATSQHRCLSTVTGGAALPSWRAAGRRFPDSQRPTIGSIGTLAMECSRTT